MCNIALRSPCPFRRRVHGRNRLAGNSLLECVVYGVTAGRQAVRDVVLAASTVGSKVAGSSMGVDANAAKAAAAL
jgi:aspartate oxidase